VCVASLDGWPRLRLIAVSQRLTKAVQHLQYLAECHYHSLTKCDPHPPRHQSQGAWLPSNNSPTHMDRAICCGSASSCIKNHGMRLGIPHVMSATQSSSSCM